MATDSAYSPGEIADRLAIGQVIARNVYALYATERSTSDAVAR
jgi:hypothetical protein